MCVSNTKEVMPIDEIVQKMFGIPIEQSINWTDRPMKKREKMIAACNVVFLIELADRLIHKYMLKNFYEVSHQIMYEMCDSEDIRMYCKPVRGKYNEDISFTQTKSSLDFSTLSSSSY